MGEVDHTLHGDTHHRWLVAVAAHGPDGAEWVLEKSDSIITQVPSVLKVPKKCCLNTPQSSTDSRTPHPQITV